MNAVASRIARVNELKDRHPGLDGNILELAIALFFREKILAVGYDEPHVARASLIHPRKVDFIQNPMTDGEPDLAVLVEGRACAALCAGSPTRWNAGPTWGVARRRISHESSSSLV